MKQTPLVAIVDDEALFRTWLVDLLTEAGYRTVVAATGEEGVRLINQQDPDVALLDLRLPDGSGLDFLGKFRDADRDLSVIIMTAYGEIQTAVEAVKAGAYHFLQKPISTEDLLITLDKALEASRLRRHVAALREQQGWRFADIRLIGRSQALQRLAGMVEKVARSDSATVLLLGESGTGKDLVARAIHARSDRSDQPFLAINCSAIPEHLVESELFGHERGAFTGARDRKKGLAELAHGGSLFLDEIGDMPRPAQAKLLRFLEDSSFKRVGGTTDIRVDERLIAATNRDLQEAVHAGTFRDDLFYRLNVVPIRIPPLRERLDDVPPLVVHFVETLSRDLKRPPPAVSDAAMRFLSGYHWPGNVRELRNVIERTLILEPTDELRPEHLPAEIRGGGNRSINPIITLPPDGVALADVERALIEQAMERTDGNVTRAAELLGISRDTLRYRLERVRSD